MADLSTLRVTRLYPLPDDEVPLHGLYLDQPLGDPTPNDRIVCFSNFVMSLDGRVSISASETSAPQGVPDALANPADWRLFQELVARSDAVLVSGRYVREVAAGAAAPLVQLDAPERRDLEAWRRTHGRPAAPDVVVVTSSLDIEADAALRLGAHVVVVTGRAAPADRVANLREHGLDVTFAGSDRDVEPDALAAVLRALGYTSVYATAGPVILRLLVAAGVLDRLFVTTVSRLLGGRSYVTMIEGELFDHPVDLDLEALYLDGVSLRGRSQLFAVYRVDRERTGG